jgi:uncharacterized SAM-binding protein YcdF (DUF218 family)
MSGGPLAWKLTDAEWMKKHALAIGVPADAILLEDKSVSTLENAKYSLSLMRDNGFKSCIVVTSPPHSRRAQRTFNKIFSPEKIKVTSWPAQQSKFKLHEWWKRHEDTQPVMWETVSLIYYLMLGY